MNHSSGGARTRRAAPRPPHGTVGLLGLRECMEALQVAHRRKGESYAWHARAGASDSPPEEASHASTPSPLACRPVYPYSCQALDAFAHLRMNTHRYGNAGTHGCPSTYRLVLPSYDCVWQSKQPYRRMRITHRMVRRCSGTGQRPTAEGFLTDIWPMRMTDIDEATNNLLDWAATDEWTPQLMEVYREHLEAVADSFKLEADEVLAMLGDAAATLTAFIAEDFFSARFGERGELNLVDDYLKQRGGGESALGRQYLEALRDSTPSLYEVVGIDPGSSLTVRDLLVPDGEVTVPERQGSQSASPWDRLAARIVPLDGERVFTGAVLVLSHQAASNAQGAFDRLRKESRRFRKRAGERRRRRGRQSAVLQKQWIRSLPVAQVLSHFWLTDFLSQASAPLPELRNSDDEALVLCEVRFPIVGDAAREIGRAHV